MAKYQQLAAQDKNTVTNRPGRAEPRKGITCYQFHEINSRTSPECSADLSDMNFDISNYKNVTDEQKRAVPRESFNSSLQESKIKCNFATNTRKSDGKPPNDPKN